MKVPTIALLVWTTTEAFTVPSFIKTATRTTSNTQRASSSNNHHEFDFLLQENGLSDTGKEATATTNARTRRVLFSDEATTTNTNSKNVLLASSVGAPNFLDQQGASSMEQEDEEAILDGEDGKIDDSSYQTEFMARVKEEETNKVLEWFKNTEYQEVGYTLIIPSIIIAYGARWSLVKLDAKLKKSAAVGLDSFANDMLYNDGDYEEMQLCLSDWNKKLLWLGLSRKHRMVKAYMAEYAKRKSVSPQSISSLSYAFSLFGLSEKKAADYMVNVCSEGGQEKISSANKLLFFGNRIFETEEALQKLKSIEDVIKSGYRTEVGGNEILKVSQSAIAEASYRSLVQKGGSSDKIPTGWKILGLTEEAATDIYNQEMKSGFQTQREKVYGQGDGKYNKKGQRIDDDGALMDDDDIAEEERAKEFGGDEEEDEAPASNAYECGNCGFTLFIAEGRNQKFFGSGFVCPTCGASKDEFSPLEIDED